MLNWPDLLNPLSTILTPMKFIIDIPHEIISFKYYKIDLKIAFFDHQAITAAYRLIPRIKRTEVVIGPAFNLKRYFTGIGNNNWTNCKMMRGYWGNYKISGSGEHNWAATAQGISGRPGWRGDDQAICPV